MPDYSIVIPVYNEEKRIPGNIEQIFKYFQNRPESTEFIFVNDGSKDRTADLLKEYQSKYMFEIIGYDQNRGKGYAVKQGALSSKGGWIIFFDIDLATPLDVFDDFIKNISGDDHVIIGSRRLENSKIEKSESKVRTFLGHGFTKISNLLVPEIKDFTCGFKCFSKKAVDTIFRRARISRWGFDTELLYIAKLNNLKIKQIPVRWKHDDQSKVKVVRAIFSSLKELFQMKFNQLRGFYK